MNISFEMTGLSKAQERVKILAERTDELGMQPLYRKVGEYLIDEARRRIMVGGDPPWLPSQFPSNLHPLLRKTGRLYDSLNYGNIKTTSDGVQLGEDLPPYAVFQQQGTTAQGRGTIRTKSTMERLRRSVVHGSPPRRFLYVDSKNRAHIKEMVKDYIKHGIL